jgi:arsenate reductase-like glutaredoxin family protein
MTPVAIFHNPACGTSRNVLALIRHSVVEPRIVECPKHPPAARPFSKEDGEPVIDPEGCRVVR